MHCVLTAHLIDKGRDRQLALYPADDIEVRHTGLNHHHVSPFCKVEGNFMKCFVAVGDVHLIAVLAAGTQVSARAYGVAKRSVIG